MLHTKLRKKRPPFDLHQSPPMVSSASEILIDEKFQGKGYGTAATKLVLNRMKGDGRHQKVVLCYIEENDAARNLYERFEVVEIDRDEDEIIMELTLS